MNGSRLSSSEYTANNGTSVVLAYAAAAGDTIDIIGFESAGPQGIQGPQGVQGLDGAFAAQGIQGPQGPQGVQGFSFNKTATTVTATGGQTTFNVNYSVGNIDVFLNGARLSSSEYTASNGTSVVLAFGAAAGDTLDFIAFESAGPQGTTGAQGIQGAQGLDGAFAAQGIQGVQGTQGIQGFSFSKVTTSFTATSGQTTFSVVYSVGTVDVFLNGSRLSESEFTATNGTSIVLAYGASAGDTVDVIAFTSAGPQGTTGIQGIQGIQGIDGAYAAQGIQGTTGIQGIAGAGADNTIYATDITTNADYYPVFINAAGISTDASIRTTSTAFSFNPSTCAVTAASFNSASDATLKTDITTLSNSIETLKKLNPVSFKWKSTGAQSYGIIAQELEKVLPELVSNQNDVKSVSYTPLIAMLIDSVITLENKINSIIDK